MWSSKMSRNLQILILMSYNFVKPSAACIVIGLFQKLEAPPRQTYVQLKIWEFPGSNFDLKKMGILGIPNFLCQK